MADTQVSILDATGQPVPLDAQQTTAGDRQQTVSLGDGQNPGRVAGIQSDGALKVASNVATAAALTAVNSATTSQQLLPANPNRRGAMLVNDSTAVLYVAYAATATTTLYTAKVAAGGTFSMDEPVYTGAVSGIWAAANGACRMTDLTA